jgi:long-chain acyl-CoA synthetase
MLCYTSGTTGDPKAAKLSNKIMIAAISAASKACMQVSMDDVFISYLPLAHSFEQVAFCLTCSFGGTYGFYSGDPLKLVDDC